MWHGTQLARVVSYGAPVPPGMIAVHLGFMLACAAVGLWSTWGLLRRDRVSKHVGPFRRFRWVVGLLYFIILVLGVAPELARAAGLTPLAVGSVLLAGAGVIGLAIGFGSQTLVKDVITGLFILIEDTISVGDVVDALADVTRGSGQSSPNSALTHS